MRNDEWSRDDSRGSRNRTNSEVSVAGGGARWARFEKGETEL